MPKVTFRIKHLYNITLKKSNFPSCRFAYDARLRLDKLSVIPLWLGRIGENYPMGLGCPCWIDVGSRMSLRLSVCSS